jgi:hypothetical protein
MIEDEYIPKEYTATNWHTYKVWHFWFDHSSKVIWLVHTGVVMWLAGMYKLAIQCLIILCTN